MTEEHSVCYPCSPAFWDKAATQEVSGLIFRDAGKPNVVLCTSSIRVWYVSHVSGAQGLKIVDDTIGHTIRRFG